MIKKMAWNTFKNTGDINTFLELKEIQNIESQIGSVVQIKGKNIQQIQHQMEEQNGNNKDEWYNNI